MPRGVLVGDATLVDHPITLETSLCILLFIAWHTDHLLVTWDEALASYWLQTDLAAEALLMPLLALVLKLLHTCLEQAPTPVTPGRKVVVMAVRTVQPVILVGKGMIDQGHLAITALEASLMPVLVLVRQVLRVGAYGRAAGLTRISEERFVTLDTERLLIPQDVPVAGQIEVTVEAREDCRRVLDLDLGELLLHLLSMNRLTTREEELVTALPLLPGISWTPKYLVRSCRD